jgi:hypothetical protein
MGIAKSQLGDADRFVRYDQEDVMFRYDGATRKFFRKFDGDAEETEVPHDGKLLNDALRFGDEIDAATYNAV